MMEVKLLEIRDAATFIPVMCVNANSREVPEAWLLRRAGYANDGEPCIILVRIAGGSGAAHCDGYSWGDRTFSVAHEHIINNWHRLRSGDVVDVQFILGETTAPKMSERNPAGILSC